MHSLATTQNHAIFGDGQTTNAKYSGNSNSEKPFDLDLERVEVIGSIAKFSLQCKKLIVLIFQHFRV